MSRRSRRGRGARWNWAILPPTAAAIVLLVWFTLPSSQPSGEMPQADAHLLITMSGWSPNHMEAKAGVPMTIMLMTDSSERSMSDSTHSFVLNATGTNEQVVAGSTRTFTITFPHAGTYTFWCTTCCGGTRTASMAGKATVT